jgi:dynein heavy chain
LINRKLEEKDCGEGPNLENIFEDDIHMKDVQENIIGCLNKAFIVADGYRSKFEPYRKYFEENEKTLVTSISGDRDVAFYRKWLGRYRLEHIQAKACPVEKELGLILVDTREMKSELLPSPLKCLEILYEILPYQAKTVMDRLIQVAQDAVIKLEGEPVTTMDFVNILKFMDKIQEQIDGIEEDAETVKDLYSLVEQYQVPVNPEDLAVYQSLRPEVSRLRSAVDKAVSNREQYVDKFCSHLNKDIMELSQEVKDIKNEAQKPAILDPTSDGDKILDYLKELLFKLNDLQDKAFQYKSYQKAFKVEVSRFEDLEETHAEVKLKQTLWLTQKSWEIDYTKWMQENFDELQPDTVGSNVLKYNKTVYQLEKGLPPNGVVPTLKFKVEAMKDMLPVITDLRNPSLKPRHWSLIEEVIGHKFDSDMPLTLDFLKQLQVFDYTEAIQEISGQASSEASLEAILKKVITNRHIRQ